VDQLMGGPASPVVDSGRHVVQCYADEDDLTRGVGTYLGGALEAGEACLVVATRRHRQAFERHLAARGADVDRLREEGGLVLLDAEEALARFMVAGRPDPDRFDGSIGARIRSLTAGGRQLRAYGEMVSLLWDAGQVTASIELEELWNQLLSRSAFSLYCAYPASSVEGHDAVAWDDVCRLHSVRVGNPGDGREPTGKVPSVERDFEGDVSTPLEVRRFVAAVLDGWGEGPLVEVTTLVATELVTNAIVHGESRVTVQIAATGTGVRLSVGDTSSALPALGRASAHRSSGRGLTIVSRLASSWGAEATIGGKVVWAELAR
jgi:hypothetical protein